MQVVISRGRICDQIDFVGGVPEVGEHARIPAAGHDQVDTVELAEQLRESVHLAHARSFVYRIHHQHDSLYRAELTQLPQRYGQGRTERAFVAEPVKHNAHTGNIASDITRLDVDISDSDLRCKHGLQSIRKAVN